MASLLGTILRELIARDRAPRVPEPDLVMNDPAKVEAFVHAGREAKVIMPTYVFHCCHICEVIRPGDTVIDLACGPATQLGLLARLNPQTRFIGVDFSQEMLRHARDNMRQAGLENVEFHFGDITDLGRFAGQSVDAIYSTLSLHHLPDVEALGATMAEVGRVLKPGGGIYISDFSRLKLESSMRHFAFQHRENQSELFTQDYLNSLRAAFGPSDYRQLLEQHLAGRAVFYSTAPLPIMMAIKSSIRRKPEGALSSRLAELASGLPQPQLRDLKSLIMLFRWAGLRTALPIA